MAFLYGIDMNLCTENINITYRDDPDPLSFTDPHFKYVFKYGARERRHAAYSDSVTMGFSTVQM